MVSVGVFCGGFSSRFLNKFHHFLRSKGDGMFDPSQDLGYYNDGIFDFGDVKISK